MTPVAPIAVFAAAFLTVFSPARSAPQALSYEQQVLFDSANRERQAEHLHPLKWDEALARAALKHAELMAAQNNLSHQLPGEPDLAMRAGDAGASFSQVRENIGETVEVATLHEGWMHSPGHRANILDPTVDSVGIALAQGRKGHLFAVEDFARALEPLTMEEQEKRVALLLESRGLKRIQTGDDARKACSSGSGYAGGRSPRYIAQFQTVDLSRLPESLAKAIETRRYTSAAVGACPALPAGGFSRYRLAVVLF